MCTVFLSSFCVYQVQVKKVQGVWGDAEVKKTRPLQLEQILVHPKSLECQDFCNRWIQPDCFILRNCGLHDYSHSRSWLEKMVLFFAIIVTEHWKKPRRNDQNITSWECCKNFLLFIYFRKKKNQREAKTLWREKNAIFFLKLFLILTWHMKKYKWFSKTVPKNREKRK